MLKQQKTSTATLLIRFAFCCVLIVPMSMAAPQHPHSADYPLTFVAFPNAKLDPESYKFPPKIVDGMTLSHIEYEEFKDYYTNDGWEYITTTKAFPPPPANAPFAVYYYEIRVPAQSDNDELMVEIGFSDFGRHGRSSYENYGDSELIFSYRIGHLDAKEHDDTVLTSRYELPANFMLHSIGRVWTTIGVGLIWQTTNVAGVKQENPLGFVTVDGELKGHYRTYPEKGNLNQIWPEIELKRGTVEMNFGDEEPFKYPIADHEYPMTDAIRDVMSSKKH